MAIDLKNLELFVRAVALGGIGRAGEELGLSATNASLRLHALEETLSTKLLNRTTRSTSLTSDGEVFLIHARRILEEVEEAKSALATDNEQLTGNLRVTASATFARTHITPFVPEFVARHPNITLDLHLSDAIVDIVDQGFDLAFRIGELASSSLLARRLDDNPIRLVASPDYISRNGLPKKPEELSRHSCMTWGTETTWTLQYRDQGPIAVPVSGAVKVNHGSAIAEWVLAGMGIGQASLWHAGPDLRAGRLVPILPQYRVLPEIKIWALRPPGRILPKRVEAFLEFIQHKTRETNEQRYGGLIEELFGGTID